MKRAKSSLDVGSIEVSVEPFTASEESVWSAGVQNRLYYVIDQDVKTYGQGDRQNNWSWNATSEYSVSELLFPIEGIEIKFRENVYSFWINGSNTAHIKHDELPMDADKSQAVLIGFLPAAITLIVVIGIIVSVGFSWGAAMLGMTVFVMPVVGGFIYKHSLEARSQDALIRAAAASDET